MGNSKVSDQNIFSSEEEYLQENSNDKCFNCSLKIKKGQYEPVRVRCDGIVGKPCQNVQHLKCAGLKKTPKDIWRCQDCEKAKKKSVKKITTSRNLNSSRVAAGNRNIP